MTDEYDRIMAERRFLGYRHDSPPFADCICWECRSPLGCNRCGGLVPTTTTYYEHREEFAGAVRMMAL